MNDEGRNDEDEDDEDNEEEEDEDDNDPTRIHTLRKYVGQAKGNAGVETVRAKQ